MSEVLSSVADLAKKKPGHARDLLLNHAASLAHSAPGDVAGFLDSGARIFLDLGNRSMASKIFTKAREAERTYETDIDEQTRRQLFADFAAAGAISPKELSAESKDLARRLPAAQALDAYLALIIEVIGRGQPPYQQLPADLRRLSKAAQQNPAEAAARLLPKVLLTPAIAQAPQQFWVAYRDQIVALAQADPGLRQTLIDLDPTEVDPDTWFDLLLAAGLAEELSHQPEPLRWIERVVHSRWMYTYWGKLSELVRQLPLQGQTLRLNHRVTPELGDALLQAGAQVPTELMPDWFYGWATHDEAPPLNFLAAHPAAASCADDVMRVCRKEPDGVLRHAGGRKLVGLWLAQHLGEDATALTVLSALRTIRPLCTPEGRAALAEPFAVALQHCQPEQLLARSLRDGLLAEYTWPALEQAAETLLTATPKATLTCHESWPNVGVAAQGHVIWVDGQRRVAEAKFDPMHGTGHQRWRYLLVGGITGCQWEYGSQLKFSWSHEPDVAHPAARAEPGNYTTFEVPTGRLVGKRMVQVGDPETPFPAAVPLLSDGQRYWIRHLVWRELDPLTGLGPVGLPRKLAVLMEQLAPDRGCLRASWAPATPTTAASRMPTQDGVHGWVETMLTEHTSRYLQVTGHWIDGPAGLAGRILRPGGRSWLVGADGSLYREDGQQLLPAEDEYGHSFLLHRVPINGWHQFQSRSMEVSTRLRNATAQQLAAVVATAPTSQIQVSSFAPWPTSSTPLPQQAKQAAAAFLGSSDEALVCAVVWLAARVKAISALAGELLAG